MADGQWPKLRAPSCCFKAGRCLVSTSARSRNVNKPYISSHIFWLINDHKLRLSISVLIFPYPTISLSHRQFSAASIWCRCEKGPKTSSAGATLYLGSSSTEYGKIGKPNGKQRWITRRDLRYNIYSIIYSVYIYIYTILSKVSVHFMVIYGWISIFTHIYIYFLGSYYSNIASKNIGFPWRIVPWLKNRKITHQAIDISTMCSFFWLDLWSKTMSTCYIVYIAVPCEMSIFIVELSFSNRRTIQVFPFIQHSVLSDISDILWYRARQLPFTQPTNIETQDQDLKAPGKAPGNHCEVIKQVTTTGKDGENLMTNNKTDGNSLFAVWRNLHIHL